MFFLSYIRPMARIYCTTSTSLIRKIVTGNITFGVVKMKDFRKIAITPDAIGRAVRFAIDQPADVDVSEIIVRPVANLA